MQIKNAVKMLTPPVCWGVARQLRDWARPRPPEWEYTPDGFTGMSARGWNQQSVASAEMSRWAEFCRLVEGSGPLGISHESSAISSREYFAHNTIMSFAYVLAVASRGRDSISMLDWGGNLGHYYVIARALLSQVEIDYHCKDVPVLVEAAKQNLPGTHFFFDEAECGTQAYDLVFASGSLQYSQDWKSSIDTLAQASKRYVYLARVATVMSAPSFTVLQRAYRQGYESEWVGWVFNAHELKTYLGKLGYTLVREFLDAPGPKVHGAPENFEYRGFLFQKDS